ncbi:YqhG family protein [Cohnella zeiphila]|uniref:Uncharacterized protein n=1 Tax=Cohnella zeiphila TaxID=2761120 RepID=A0A7X0SW51_9BACL|nr:YqhG family protein [Cohnella zeiphila]MBB6736020.1 hypothetical protein [Cohnella zeiphila]
MNSRQVQKFVMSYLQSTQSQIIEKGPSHVVVRLSPEADRALTNRPYYWSFVDRTGAEPETMTFRWSFEPPGEEALPGAAPVPAPAAEPIAQADPSPLTAMLPAGARILRDNVYFGSSRLQQIFESVRQAGRCVMLFEEPAKGPGAPGPLGSRPYTAWLGANFKVSFECDMKREELYGWGISLATGIVDERFLDRLRSTKLTPRLPANVHLLRNGLTLRKALGQLESALERKLRSADFGWAAEADERRLDELARIEQYYRPMIERAATPEQAEALENRRRKREEEIDWQYRPRVRLNMINCGVFHLPGIE